MLDNLKENETVSWAINTFIKVSTGGAIAFGILLFAREIIGLSIDASVSIGL